MTLGDRIEEIVKMSGLTQQKFYERIGVSKSTFHNWKSGEKGIAFEYLSRILQIFEDINPRWLILGEGEMKLLPTKPENIVEEPAFKYGDRPLTKSDLSTVLKKLAAEIDKV